MNIENMTVRQLAKHIVALNTALRTDPQPVGFGNTLAMQAARAKELLIRKLRARCPKTERIPMKRPGARGRGGEGT